MLTVVEEGRDESVRPLTIVIIIIIAISTIKIIITYMIIILIGVIPLIIHLRTRAIMVAATLIRTAQLQ